MEKFDPSLYTQNSSKSTKQEAVYSDIPLSFDFHPGTKDVTRLLDDDAVKASLKNILKTSRYERTFNPLFGANLNRMLFEQLDERSIENIDVLIRSAVESFEPRVNLLDVVVGGLIDENTLAVTLFYTVLNRPARQQLDLTIVRVR